MPYAVPMPPETAPSPLDYALQRLLEGMADDDVQEAAFWLGVLAALLRRKPPGGSVH